VNTEELTILPESTPSEPVIVTVDAIRFPRALDVLEEAFPDVSRAFFHAIAHSDPFIKPEYLLGIEVKNRILSYLQIFERTLQFGGQSIKVGGIGSVGTRPKEQGKGYCGQLIHHALQCMEQQNMESAILFTKINGFYEKFGFETISQFEQEIRVSSLQKIRPSFRHYRRILEKDCEKIQQMYSAQLNQNQGHVVRTPEYWDCRAFWMNHVPTVVLDGENLLGYFYVSKYQPSVPVLSITEYGMVNTDSKTIELMLGSMARKAEELSCRSIKGFLCHTPALEAYVTEHRIAWQKCAYNYMMWRDFSGFSHIDRVKQLGIQNRFLYWQTDAF
jgi:predicted GNAT family N-acyltransferase